MKRVLLIISISLVHFGVYAALQNSSKAFFRVLSDQMKNKNKNVLWQFNSNNANSFNDADFFQRRSMGLFSKTKNDLFLSKDINSDTHKEQQRNFSSSIKFHKQPKSLALIGGNHKVSDTFKSLKKFAEQQRLTSSSSNQIKEMRDSSSGVSIFDEDPWLSQFDNDDVFARIDEAPKVLSNVKAYVPEAYAALNPLQKKLESEPVYNDFIKQYELLKKAGLSIKKVTYKVDGQDVTGFVLLPKKRTDGKKHPLVVSFRGGFNGHGMFHEWAKIDLPWIMRHYAFLAKNGYAVLASQYRNADGNTNKDEFGGADVNDVMGLFDVADELGNIDLKDISFNAFSRGTVMLGQTLARLKTERPHIYKNIKAAIIKGGISDLETFMHEDPKYIKPILEQARDDFNERKDAILKEISLVRKPEVLKSIPTLVMHNKHDNVVPATLSHNLIKQLKKNGVKHEVNFFPGKHHQILEFNDQVHQLSLDWLQKHRTN